jgi:hypothetical protein
VNNTDPRAEKFLRKKAHYSPALSNDKFVKDFYIPDRKMVRMFGKHIYKIPVDDRVALKALIMLKDYIWHNFFEWEKEKYKRGLKITENFDIQINLISKQNV